MWHAQMGGAASSSADCSHPGDGQLACFELFEVFPYGGVTLHFDIILFTDHGVELFHIPGCHRFLVGEAPAHSQQHQHGVSVEVINGFEVASRCSNGGVGRFVNVFDNEVGFIVTILTEFTAFNCGVKQLNCFSSIASGACFFGDEANDFWRPCTRDKP